MKLAILLVVGVIAKVYGDEPEPIVGGTTAYVGQFPHQISLRQNGYHICGGTIIGDKTVITAAHCIPQNQQSSLTVVSGTNHIQSGGQVHRIKCIQVHPQYDTRNNWNDIAIITLAQPITFSQLQRSIPLASADYANGQTRCIVSGWGQLSATNRNPPTLLQYVELTAITLNACRKTHSNVFEKQLCCFDSRGKGACMGDSGGPLICNGQLCGVVSWGIPCGVGYPDVFTNVYHYQSWITQNQHKC